MANMNIPRINGRVVANVSTASSYYQKNKLGKFTDKNSIETMLRLAPEKYDKAMIRLFTDARIYSNDFVDLVMNSGTPFIVNDPNAVFSYKIKKRAELPKIIVNLADTTARPGVDGQTFELVFDKNAFSQNDIISAHRREQETNVQIVSEGQPYQNFFKYTCKAVGDDADAYVHQRFLGVGTEYMKIGNILGEMSTVNSSIGLIDGSLEVVNDVLQKYGVEHSITEAADATKLGVRFDAAGNPLNDITYYTVADINAEGQAVNVNVGWEPTVSKMMRMEMIKMKANTLMWGRSGNTTDEKGRPGRAKAGLWQQMHIGNVIHYDRGQFSINLLRSAVGDLFYNRVRVEDRHVKIYTNRSGMELAATAMKKDFNGSGFTVLASEFLDNTGNSSVGDKRLKMGYAYQFDHFTTTETGRVDFKELEQLNEAATQLELGPNKKTPPIYIILDISGEDGSNIRECKLGTRPNMLYKYIPGMTDSAISKMFGNLATSKDPWDTVVMQDYCGIFLEDPTKSILIKEYPQL